jgi:hypothetical protein
MAYTRIKVAEQGRAISITSLRWAGRTAKVKYLEHV